MLAESTTIADAYEQRDFAKAMRIVMSLADRINQYIDEQQPWVVAKQEDQDAKLQGICSQAISGFAILIIYLKPVLPELAENAEKFLDVTGLDRP